MTIAELNTINIQQAFDELFKCCSCTIWAQNVIDFRPYKNKEELFRLSNMVWTSCDEEEVLQAFPKPIVKGNTVSSEIDIVNQEYENKFGYSFVVSSTPKTEKEKFELLKIRLLNDNEKEFRIAKEEQNKIIQMRLDALFV